MQQFFETNLIGEMVQITKEIDVTPLNSPHDHPEGEIVAVSISSGYHLVIAVMLEDGTIVEKLGVKDIIVLEDDGEYKRK